MRWDERLTIRGRLFALLLALAVPFSIYVALSTWSQALEEREHAGQQMFGIARLSSARLDDYVGDIRQLLTVLAAVAEPTTAAMPANDALLRSLTTRLPPHLENIGIWTGSGENVGALDPRYRAARDELGWQKFFRRALESDTLHVDAPVPGVVDGQPVVIFAVAIERLGKRVGVVTASARLRGLQALISPEGTLPVGAVTTVASASGVILARSLDPDRWVGRLLLLPGGASVPSRDGVRDGPTADGVQRIGGSTTANRLGWRIYVGLPTDAALRPVMKRLAETVLVGMAMLAMGMLAAAAIGQRISGPLRQLGNDAEAIERGNLQQRSRIRQGGEIGRLADTLNRMAGSLQERTESLLASQTQLQQITDNLPVMISYLDREQRFRFANSVYQKWVGFAVADLIGKTVQEVYGATTYAAFSGHLARALEGHRVVHDRDLETLTGLRRVEVTLVPDRPTGAEVQGLFVLMQDVTANRDAAAQRARSEERLTLALDGSGSALFDWDIPNDRIYHSAQAAALRGDPAKEETTTPAKLREGVHPDDRESMMAAFKSALTGQTEGYMAEFRIATRCGGWVWLRSKGRVVERHANGRAIRLAGIYADITPAKTAEARLRHMAEFDALTELPNRVLFHDRLARAMARCARSGKTSALLFLDIDHFKAVNDTLGHEAGDRLLVSFARTLQDCVRASDTVARFAGDEFTIILEEIGGAADAEAIAGTLIERARQTLALQGRSVSVSASIGIALLTPGEADPAAILRRADAALYEAKRSGRNRFATDFEACPIATTA